MYILHSAQNKEQTLLSFSKSLALNTHTHTHTHTKVDSISHAVQSAVWTLSIWSEELQKDEVLFPWLRTPNSENVFT